MRKMLGPIVVYRKSGIATLRYIYICETPQWVSKGDV
jgi:hypothetical protein